jgi:protocatechuate 3,4-dioxygenase beta subunit
MANATGHYAGHPDPQPHLKDEMPQVGGKRSGLLSPFPLTMNEETWLRGAWPTDKNGVAQFTSIFPGYYTGRATHVHTKVFTEWDVLPNSTFTSNKLAHVGQFFFDDKTNLQVDKVRLVLFAFTCSARLTLAGRIDVALRHKSDPGHPGTHTQLARLA